jgi:hypothetical protein
MTAAAAPARARKTREFTFADCPFDFHPNVSPEEMLRRGVFGVRRCASPVAGLIVWQGSYFRPYYSKVLKCEFHDDWADLPKAWYEGLDVDRVR